MKVLKKLVMATAAVAISASAAMAERYVMITHTQGTDPFWPVVEKGGRDAAKAVGATLEYNFDVSGDIIERTRRFNELNKARGLFFDQLFADSREVVGTENLVVTDGPQNQGPDPHAG